MNSLERILGSQIFRSLDSQQRIKIQELIDANHAYSFLLPGLIKYSKNWREEINQAYLEYVQGQRPSKSIPFQPAASNAPAMASAAVFMGTYDENTTTIAKKVMV